VGTVGENRVSIVVMVGGTTTIVVVEISVVENVPDSVILVVVVDLYG
jgi:hypothetical protein